MNHAKAQVPLQVRDQEMVPATQMMVSFKIRFSQNYALYFNANIQQNVLKREVNQLDLVPRDLAHVAFLRLQNADLISCTILHT